jgi:transcriptional regulator with XRE-family HTH domain
MRRRIVGAALRRYREQLGYALEDAAQILDCDRSKISRIETGQRGIRQRELFELLTEYGAAEQMQNVLAMIANPRSVRGWWRDYADVLPDTCLDYVALETAASRISIFSGQQVPDLLQTEQYASAVARARPGRSPAELQHLTDMCMLRQAILTESWREVVVVIGEAALRQAVGGHEVMHAQLTSLADAISEFPKVSIRVLPFTSRAHVAGAAGSFTVLRYAEASDLGVVHLAGISGGAFLGEQQDVMAYASAFEQLEMSALSPDASACLIRQISEVTRT